MRESPSSNQKWRGSVGPGALLALIREHEPVTRARLVRESGLVRSTTSERLDSLVRTGYVSRLRRPVSTGGRPAESFVFNTDAGHILLADIGGSHTRFGVSTLDGVPFRVGDVDLDIDDGPTAVLGYVRERFVDLCTQLAVPRESIHGLGIGVPGPVDPRRGRLVRPRTMPGWGNFDVAAFFAAEFDRAPVFVDKDANIMALGENRLSWPNVETMLCIKAGIGIGCGVIVDGRVLHGADGAAGDIGHIPRPSDVGCRCGQFGCVEATAGGYAIAAKLRKAGRRARSSRDIVDLVKAGDTLAMSLVRNAGREIGGVLIPTIAVTNPSLVVVGGNLSESPEPLLAGIREVVYSNSHPLATQDLQILPSTIGSDAGLAGAAQMVLDGILTPDAVDRAVASGVFRPLSPALA